MAPKRNMTQQSYRTPPAFLAAVLRRFKQSHFDFDLACSAHDKVAPDGFEYPLCNALEQDWRAALEPDWLSWINPTFNISADWAERCAGAERRILGLFPASVSTVWFRTHIHNRAEVIFFQPRLFFLNPQGQPILNSKGAPAPIDRDCMLIAWGLGTPGRYNCENWNDW